MTCASRTRFLLVVAVGRAGRLPPRHRPVWVEHAATTTRVFLETRGCPDPNEHAPRRRSTEPPASSPRSTRWISPACGRAVAYYRDILTLASHTTAGKDEPTRPSDERPRPAHHDALVLAQGGGQHP